MKRFLAALACTATAALVLLGCDAQNLPVTANTPTTVAAAPSATTTSQPHTPTASASATKPALASTPTAEEQSPTATESLIPSETATTEPGSGPTTSTPAGTTTANPTRTLSAVTRTPLPTARPRATGTPIPLSPVPATSSGNTEPAPSGGWREVVRVAPGKKRIALTFDAGASGEPWPRIMAALRERNIHITMFFTGKFAEQYPDAIRQAAADGHEIANHTYSHLDSRKLTDEQLTDELSRTEAIIQSLAGVTTKPYWRPPFGARNNHVLSVAAAQGYRSIYWSLDSLDSIGQPKTAEFIFNRVTNTPGVELDGAIILQHFGSDASADALPRELDRLAEMGLRVVTISELLSP